jgi:menaquinone-dependent protoporphyrinogen IX oxidase
MAGNWLEFIAKHCYILATEKSLNPFSKKHIKIIITKKIALFCVSAAFSSQTPF